MGDLLDVLRLVATRLDEAGVRYMMSGSLALGYDALPHMTRDIDIVVELVTFGLTQIDSTKIVTQFFLRYRIILFLLFTLSSDWRLQNSIGICKADVWCLSRHGHI